MAVTQPDPTSAQIGMAADRLNQRRPLMVTQFTTGVLALRSASSR
jgi:hypothetical protein